MKTLIALFVVASLVAEAQVLAPQPSPSATVSTVVGLTDVKVDYSRPKMKGRKVFGEGNDFITPYGHIWRTGANQGTNVTFSDDVKIGNSTVAKGTYRLLSIPGATEWTVIFSKDMTLAGNDPEGYKQENDAARITVKSEKIAQTIETFTIEISDIADNSKMANLQIMWENTSVKVPFSVDFDKKVQASIDANTKVNPNNLFAAANYYYDNGKDMKQALDWATAAAAARPDAYWMLHLKAKIQKSLGDKAGAIASANASKTIAQKDNDAAYVKMNDDLIKSLK